MTTDDGPTGYVSSEVAVLHQSLLVRSLGPQRSRRLGAVLVLASAMATFWVSEAFLGRSLVTMPTGTLAVLQFAPLASGVVLTLGLAVFVLGGSPAARVFGSLAAAAGLAPLLLFLLLGVSVDDLGPLVVPWATAVFLHVATILALVLPHRAAAAPYDGAPGSARAPAGGATGPH